MLQPRSGRLTLCSEKNLDGPANGTLADIHAYARGTFDLVACHSLSLSSIVALQKTPIVRTVLTAKPLSTVSHNHGKNRCTKFYIRANRLYKQITYYTWRFAEIHVYKLVLFLMVLTSTLKVRLADHLSLHSSVFLPTGQCIQCDVDHSGHGRSHPVSSTQDDQSAGH